MATKNVVEELQRLRTFFESGATADKEWRKRQLKACLAMCKEESNAIAEACQKDLRKHALEVEVTEVGVIRQNVEYLLSRLDDLMGPQPVEVGPVNKLDGCSIVPEPLGAVLCFGPFNYPIQLCFLPVVSALAAGNVVLLKPSELAPATSALMSKLFPKYFDSRAISVVEGGPEVAQALLDLKWDHIFYTGSTRVGRIIMTAAAKNLTPVTLELGGKSPCIVDSTITGSGLESAAKRIVWGRYLNAGQSCVAPDYVLVEAKAETRLVDAMCRQIEELFTATPKTSDSLGRIINRRHFDRLKRALDEATRKGAKIVAGGECDADDLYIAPTVLVNVPEDCELLTEEIFGPILPIVKVNNVKEAINYVNKRPKPLALYVFTTNKSVSETVLATTSSGGAMVNDCMVHCGIPGLPFGGVGESGMGSYHSSNSFRIFSHYKSVVKRQLGLEWIQRVRYPPYEMHRMGFARFAGKLTVPSNRKWGWPLFSLFAAGVGVVVGLSLEAYNVVNW